VKGYHVRLGLVLGYSGARFGIDMDRDFIERYRVD
jgi:hypothetical protein